MHHALTLLDLLARLGLALGLGAAIGIERELSAQPAGTRTHVLVAMGAALFTAGGQVFGPHNDMTRVAAQVVSGIGFLGAGAILRDRGRVKGLTTAASLWLTAAVGLAVGFGYFAAAALFTVAALVVLTMVRQLEDRLFPALRGKPAVVVVRADADLERAVASVRGLFPAVEVQSVRTLDGGEVAVQLRLPTNEFGDIAGLSQRLLVLPEVSGVDVRS